jgi:hypothetical protein
MAASRTPGPVDFNSANEFAGELPRCATSVPGPVGWYLPTGYRSRPVSAPPAISGWFRLALSLAGSSPQTSEESTTIVRITLGSQSDFGGRRLVFKTREEAAAAAVRLTKHPFASAELRQLSGVNDHQLAVWTSVQLYVGGLKILVRDESGGSVAAPVSTRRASPRRSPLPPPRNAARSSRQSPAYSTFPADFDAGLVAEQLKQAAKEGVPFCEECMKAREAQHSDPAAVPV